MAFSVAGALLAVALVSASVASSVHKSRQVGEHYMARQIHLATNPHKDFERVALRRVKRDEVADLREELSQMQKIIASDESKISKLSSSIAMLALAMKGDQATIKEKTDVISAKMSVSENKEAPNVGERSLPEVLTRSQTNFKRLISRAELEFAKLKAIVDG